MLTATGGLPRATRAATRFQSLVADHPADVALEWFQLALDLIQETAGFTPPVAARAFGYMGVTLYETLSAGIPDRPSLDGRLNDYTNPPVFLTQAAHWPAAANAALATIVRALFPTATGANRARIDQVEAAFLQDFTAGTSTRQLQRSISAGQQVARHVFDWAMDDGGHEGYLNNFPNTYVPPVGSGLWVPTSPGFQPALQPFWGDNRSFTLQSNDQFDPGPPPPFSTNPASVFFAEAWEVYETVNNLTDEQRDIAIFWADDPVATSTPPGHSISILTQVLASLGSDLAMAAEAYLKVGIAVADAFISCWKCKYAYNLLRPISYIQAHIDASWGNPLPVSTPPFPEYTSGHSVQTGAFAQIAEHLFGNLAFTDHTHDALGLAPRMFDSWSELAEETAISRLYGGIHYRAAIDLGVVQGVALGEHVAHTLDGTTPPGRGRWRG